MTALAADEQALLRTICTDPEDDTPRLVFADYLDDRSATGDAERAEFVRVQCEIARMDVGDRCPVCDWPYTTDGGCEPGNCSFRPDERSAEYPTWKRRHTDHHSLRRRERELIQSVGRGHLSLPPFSGSAWALTPYDDDHPDVPKIRFRRGFVEAVSSCQLDVFVGLECERCGGTGDAFDASNWGVDCMNARCENGRVGGIARDLFRIHPVTRVILSDRYPVQTSGGLWEYPVSDDPTRTGAIPWAVYDLFPNYRLRTEELAADALSFGLVSFARRLVGLPPLERLGAA